MRSGSRLLLKYALHHYKDTPVDLNEYYRCNISKLCPELSACFVKLALDAETQVFLDKSKKRASNVCLQVFYAAIQLLLGLFFSQTTINGLLERGKMFVFSREQLRSLLSSCLDLTPKPPQQPLILDIGSGDGHVTDQLRSLFSVPSLHVTETSKVMQRVLRQRGYKVLNESSWHLEECKYDIITCLNVLDRCDNPLSMLRQITDKLCPDGVLVIALVLPYEPFVENHSLQSEPSEELPINNTSWETGVSSLWEEVLKPLGYTPLALSRVPYLCEGDMNQDYYALDDAILVLKSRSCE